MRVGRWGWGVGLGVWQGVDGGFGEGFLLDGWIGGGVEGVGESFGGEGRALR